jgi:hypothetical protein
MTTKKVIGLGVIAVAVTLFVAGSSVNLDGQQNATVRIDSDDIGGVVTGANGPEAGVWVIAETSELPTKFAKIVVTDDSRALRAARSAQGELYSMGARLWAG